MDQFGVFTESYGLKPQGKSAPMAASKRQGSSINEAKSTARNSSSLNGSDTMTQNYGGAGDGYDVFFGNFSDQRTSKSSFDYDSFFGGSNDFGAKSSQFSGYNDNDDIFGGLNSSASAKLSDDVFASFGSNKGSSRDGGDLLGNFGDQPKASNPNTFDAAGLYDWSDGFGANMQTNQPRQPADSTFMKSEDPFAVLESTSNTAYSSPDLFSAPLQENTHFNIGGVTKLNVSSNASLKLRPPPKPSQVVKPDQVKSSYASEIDELEDFAMGGPGNNYNKEKLKIPTVSKKASNLGMGIRERQNAKPSRDKVADDAAMKNQQEGEGDLESFFSMSTRSSSAPKSRNTTSVPNKKEPEGVGSTFSGSSSSIKRASSETNLVDDLSSVFGASPMFGEFEEVDGESEERRRARMGRLKRTEERAAKALADMTQRDLQTQREQNERCRIAEIVDFDVKRWAAGKENNMRALLSSLHQVLWPECGWQPVSLTDMITSTSVKKVYRKATLCIHPDKVQQKGATLQQKYTAEKVFDILKEAWNKFNKEELS